MIIDAHQHFWTYNDRDYVWMEDWMHGLKSDHEPKHLKPLMEPMGIIGTIAVQARQMVSETEYLLDLAQKTPWIMGVVGWIDFSAQDIECNVAQYAGRDRFVGLRELIHDMADPDYAISSVHVNAIRLIGTYDLSYDLLLRPAHIPAAIKLVDMFPDQRFIVDHIAKPNIAGREIHSWQRLITELGRRPNVYCKLSGMATEAKLDTWSASDLIPYIDVCLETFGAQRLMIGSDWPVCTLAGSYETIMTVFIDYLKRLSPAEQTQLSSATCKEAYRLER